MYAKRPHEGKIGEILWHENSQYKILKGSCQNLSEISMRRMLPTAYKMSYYKISHFVNNNFDFEFVISDLQNPFVYKFLSKSVTFSHLSPPFWISHCVNNNFDFGFMISDLQNPCILISVKICDFFAFIDGWFLGKLTCLKSQ